MSADPQAGRPGRRSLWCPGSQIRLRHVLDGRTWCLLPVTVLDDRDEHTVIRISAGSVWLAAYAADAPRRAHTWVNEWRLRPTRWTGDECTYLIRPGKYYATGYFVPRGRETGGKFYVNAQTPMRRLAGSIETLDLELDVEMREPDLVPRWKDTELFKRMVDRRRLPPPLRERIREEAEEAVSELRRPAVRSLLRRMSRIPAPVPSLGSLFPTSQGQVPCTAHPLDDGAS